MGCGCGKKNNAIRGTVNSGSSNNNADAEKRAKEERRQSLKLIRINATNQTSPRKQ